jgi:nitroimidazol reductase NimA-like FMN-containing flavoprotein (pyridoxamine 5'-phosphate oxidase superfamily)
MQYRSVIGYGRAAILADPGEKRRGLVILLQHYGGGTYDFSDGDLDSVTVMRIPLDALSGKKHG